MRLRSDLWVGYLISLGLLFLPTAFSSQEPDSPIADAYMEALQEQDWARFGSYLAPDARYRDDTMDFFDRPSIDLKGREEIVEFWRSSSEDSGTSSIRYTVNNRFVAGTSVVYIIRANVRVSGEYWGIEEEEIDVEFDLVTVLRVRDGQVTEHADYVDYAEGLKQIEAYRNAESKR